MPKKQSSKESSPETKSKTGSKSKSNPEKFRKQAREKATAPIQRMAKDDRLPISVRVSEEAEAKRAAEIPDAEPVDIVIGEPGMLDPVTGLVTDEYGVPYANQDRIKQQLAFEHVGATKRRTPDGKKKRTRTPEQRRLIHGRIEEVRGLLALSMTTGDIRRALSAKWNIHPMSVWKYIKLARARQLELLGRDANELKSDSLQYWTRNLQSAASRQTRAYRELEKADKMQEKAETMMENIVDVPAEQRGEYMKSVAEILRHVAKLKDHGRRMLAAASMQSDAVQDRIDRLVGNNQPERLNLSLVTTDGQDALLPAVEPLNRQQAIREAMLFLIQHQGELPPEKRKLLVDLAQANVEVSGQSPLDSAVVDVEFTITSGMPTDIPLEVEEVESLDLKQDKGQI